MPHRVIIAGAVVVLLLLVLYQTGMLKTVEKDASSDWSAAQKDWNSWFQPQVSGAGPPPQTTLQPSASYSNGFNRGSGVSPVTNLVGGRGPSIDALAEAQRIRQNEIVSSQIGIRNDSAGYGGQRQAGPADSANRKGYLPAGRVALAEQNAWAPVDPSDPITSFNPTATVAAAAMGGMAGSGDWNQQLSDLAIDPRTLAQHKQWADEVGPFSQGSMTVDNLDEAVAMSLPRTGITAFRANAPVQGSCTQQITEIGPEQVASQFTRLYF